MLLPLIFMTTPLSADIITLKNGRTIKGIITEENQNGVTVQIDISAIVQFSKNEVERIERATPEEEEVIRTNWAWKEKPKDSSKASSSEQTSALSPQRAPRFSMAPTKENQALLSEGTWRGRATPHFKIYYEDSSQGKAIAEIAEYSLEKVAGDLAVHRGNEKGKFNVFLVKEDEEWLRFLQTLGIQPELTGGFTTGAKTREIFLHSDSIPYLKLAFPHELTHIFQEEIAKGRKIPYWYGEGFANYEGGIIGIEEELLTQSVRNGEAYSLLELVSTVGYPTDPKRKTLFYTQSEKVVEFLITQYGRRRFGNFSEALFETGDFEQAFRSVYSGKIGTIEKLEELWRRYILD